MDTLTIKTNSTEKLILSTLQSGEKSGLEIVKSFKNDKKSIEGLYPILRKLVKEGLVQSRWVTEKTKGKSKVGKLYYSLTELGRTQEQQNS
ncbi:MAG: helix-turn-helix transcriptional regulator [Crocosphaera sp.]|nr:helix-turn-helix transcriptional regulator [Crocosphaera sp.]